MGWRRYSHRLEHGSFVQPHTLESPDWVFRGCYWRWQTTKTLETLSREDEVRYLEELRAFLQEQIKNVEDRLSRLKDSP
ncbi:MAG: DUF5320 domain-containing protein [Zestosphaera sp.]